jgi:hypothetical protein
VSVDDDVVGPLIDMYVRAASELGCSVECIVSEVESKLSAPYVSNEDVGTVRYLLYRSVQQAKNEGLLE